MEPNNDQILIRMPTSLKDRAKEAAAKDGRSIASYIRYLIKSDLKIDKAEA